MLSYLREAGLNQPAFLAEGRGASEAEDEGVAGGDIPAAQAE